MLFRILIVVLISMTLLACSGTQTVKRYSKPARAEPQALLDGCTITPEKRIVSKLPKGFLNRYSYIDDLAMSALEETDPEIRREKYRATLSSYENAIESCADCNSYALSNLNFKMAIVAMQHENSKLAVVYMETALKHSKEGPLGLERNIAFSLALTLFKQERYTEAKEKFNHWESLCSARTPSDYYLIRSHTAYFLGEKKKALEYLNRGSVVAKKHNGEDGRWYKLRIELLNTLGLVDEAERVSDEFYSEKKTKLTFLPVAPIYPREATLKSLTGHCDVTFTLAITGRVKRIEELVCSDPIFSNSVDGAVMKAWIVPYIEDGKRVEAQGQKQRFSFNID